MNKIVCTRCVIDSQVPGVFFNQNGVCNYCAIHDELEREWPLDDEGRHHLEQMVAAIKRDGVGKPYDCVAGLSGGTDSTYLLYLAKQFGLRPLVVHFDNGWDSEIAVNNIKKAITALHCDLQTYVVDWEEFRDICVSFLKASLPWADAPADLAINSILYRVAAEEGVRYILNGSSFRTEGKMPSEWTYVDGRMVKHIQGRYGRLPLKSFPNLTMLDFINYSVIRRIRILRPLNYVEYHKDQAREILQEELGWQYYGGHHYESIYTRFIYSYLLPKKFKVDKRIITHSALVRSGEMTRAEALQSLQEPPYAEDKINADIEYVVKKLGLSKTEFQAIMDLPVKSFRDYPSYYPLFERFTPLMRWIFKIALPWTPPVFRELEARRGNKPEHE